MLNDMLDLMKAAVVMCVAMVMFMLMLMVVMMLMRVIMLVVMMMLMRVIMLMVMMMLMRVIMRMVVIMVVRFFFRTLPRDRHMCAGDSALHGSLFFKFNPRDAKLVEFPDKRRGIRKEFN